MIIRNTVWKVSKYGVISSSYFPVFWVNTEKYGPEKTLYLGTFDAVKITENDRCVRDEDLVNAKCCMSGF